MATQTFTHFVPKEKEGTYYTVDFTVPQNIERVTVSYAYAQPVKGVLRDFFPTNVIDIGLMDGDGRFLGWSGSAHSTIFVGEFDSTRGYLCEPVRAGTWKILVGAYRVLGDGVEVTYTVTFDEKREHLLFGDTHVHSDASDGKYDAATLGKMAKAKGLDFLALANHNNFAENFHLPHIPGLTFVPAVEWTHYKGHMNFFGVEAPFENTFVANSHEEMRALIEAVRQRGAVVSVNHPKCSICPYLWEDDETFDMVEVWNGPMRPTNQRGIAWWTELLRAGRRLPIVGGSDFHKKTPYIRLGNPVTAVYTPTPRAEDIVKSLAAGHAFVSYGRNGPRLYMEYGSARMGDSAARRPQGTLKIEVTRLRGARVVLVTDKGETPLQKQGEGSLCCTYPVRDETFMYLKVQRGIGAKARVLAIGNPIYFTA